MSYSSGCTHPQWWSYMHPVWKWSFRSHRLAAALIKYKSSSPLPPPPSGVLALRRMLWHGVRGYAAYSHQLYFAEWCVGEGNDAAVVVIMALKSHSRQPSPSQWITDEIVSVVRRIPESWNIPEISLGICKSLTAEFHLSYMIHARERERERVELSWIISTFWCLRSAAPVTSVQLMFFDVRTGTTINKFLDCTESERIFFYATVMSASSWNLTLFKSPLRSEPFCDWEEQQLKSA